MQEQGIPRFGMDGSDRGVLNSSSANSKLELCGYATYISS
jgi:hypothetical protein